jgi:predicted acylesterase/phospholipase RssA
MSNRAHRAAPRRSKLGLALAGGGPLGGIYEVGALAALGESLSGLKLEELDVYVGVSSGSFVAAALANGISPARMYRIFIDSSAGEEAITPEVFLKPAFAEFARRAVAAPKLIGTSLLDFLRPPWRHSLVESFAGLGGAIPTGIFDNRAIEGYLVRLFSRPGRSNDFRELRQRLYLVATELDSGEAVVFGEAGRDRVPIARAIQASAALPGLFTPVKINGRHYVDGALKKTLHASVALEQGVELLLCVNPLVPFNAKRAAEKGERLTTARLNTGGLPTVLSQTFRAIIHSRMKVGMEKYAQQFPKADILLFEPDSDDAAMFFRNVFSYRQRAELCEYAYQKTRRGLLARAGELAPILARHGIALREDALLDPTRTIQRAVAESDPLPRPTTLRHATRELDGTLRELERWVAGRVAA